MATSRTKDIEETMNQNQVIFTKIKDEAAPPENFAKRKKSKTKIKTEAKSKLKEEDLAQEDQDQDKNRLGTTPQDKPTLEGSGTRNRSPSSCTEQAASHSILR